MDNIELKDEVERCRLELSGGWDKEKRHEENLALLVLLFVEVEGLRARVGI
jgi:hypothetical protein